MATLRRALVPLVVAFAAILISGATLLSQLSQPALSAPFSYSQTLYTPQQPKVCPGDVLQWQAVAVVERVPAVVAVQRTVWSVERNRTVIPAYPHDTKTYIWTDRVSFGGPVTHTVPLLPAGAYELRVAGQEANSAPAVYRVPFTIRMDCAVFKSSGDRTWESKTFWPAPPLSSMLINSASDRRRGCRSLTPSWRLIPAGAAQSNKSSLVPFCASIAPIFIPSRS